MKKSFLKAGAFILALAPAISMGTQNSFGNPDEFLLKITKNQHILLISKKLRVLRKKEKNRCLLYRFLIR